jgi:hypothetical protein
VLARFERHAVKKRNLCEVLQNTRDHSVFNRPSVKKSCVVEVSVQRMIPTVGLSSGARLRSSIMRTYIRRRSWAPKCSMPICFDDCSTIDQTAQSLRVSRLIFPLCCFSDYLTYFDHAICRNLARYSGPQ